MCAIEACNDLNVIHLNWFYCLFFIVKFYDQFNLLKKRKKKTMAARK